MNSERRAIQPIISFAAGTPILTADGPKAIEGIKPGDYVVVRPPLDPRRN